MPEYYVAWMQASTPRLVVGDTTTGSVGAVIKVPEDVNLQGIYGAAANDRTFILVGNLVFAPGNVNFFYLLRIAPGGTSARLTALRTPVLDARPAGVAISPDSSRCDAVLLPGSCRSLRGQFLQEDQAGRHAPGLDR